MVWCVKLKCGSCYVVLAYLPMVRMYVCMWQYMSTVYVFRCKKTVTEYNSTNMKWNRYKFFNSMQQWIILFDLYFLKTEKLNTCIRILTWWILKKEMLY